MLKKIVILSIISFFFILGETYSQSKNTNINDLEQHKKNILEKFQKANNREVEISNLLDDFNIRNNKLKTDITSNKKKRDNVKKEIEIIEEKIKDISVRILQSKRGIYNQMLGLYFLRRIKENTLIPSISYLKNYPVSNYMIEYSTVRRVDYYTKLKQQVGEQHKEISRYNTLILELQEYIDKIFLDQKLVNFDVEQYKLFLQQIKKDKDKYNKLLSKIDETLKAIYSKVKEIKNDPKKQKLASRSTKYKVGFKNKKGSIILPTKGKLVSKFGEQTKNNLIFHKKGILIETADASPVVSVLPGKVVFLESIRLFNYLIIVDHGLSSYSVYGRLQDIEVKKDTYVEAGERLGYVTQNLPYENHVLYFEMRYKEKPINPLKWFKKTK